MILSLNRRPVSVASIAGRYRGKSVMVQIDSSKTNSALVVRTRTYKVIDVLEFNGKDDHDVIDLAFEQRKCLRMIFEGANIVKGGIEDIITKKEEESGGRASEGIKHHHSRYVITCVFDSFITCFLDYFNVKLELIPNQAWKAAVLPKELNKRSVYKGSVDYIQKLYPEYITGQKDDDVCDALCIGEYMKMRDGLSKDSLVEDIPDDEEFLLHKCKYRLFPQQTKLSPKVSTQFEYNTNLSLDLNARAIANRIELGKLGWCVLNIDQVSIEDIYQFCTNEFEERTTHLLLIVKRLE